MMKSLAYFNNNRYITFVANIRISCIIAKIMAEILTRLARSTSLDALSGSKNAFSILQPLQTKLSGSKSTFSIPNTPYIPHFKAFPGLRSIILIPSALPDGLAGSFSAFLSPNASSAPHFKAFPGSNLGYLSPQPLPGAACSGCRSGAGARSTQCCRDQRQAAASPALRLRLSLHKVRLRRPLRRLTRHQAVAERKQGWPARWLRAAPGFGAGAPVWIAAQTCEPCA